MTLREWIRAERAEGRKWTMAGIASEVGRTQWFLSRAANGATEAPVSLVQKVHVLTGGAVSLFDWPTLNGKVKRAVDSKAPE